MTSRAREAERAAAIAARLEWQQARYQTEPLAVRTARDALRATLAQVAGQRTYRAHRARALREIRAAIRALPLTE